MRASVAAAGSTLALLVACMPAAPMPPPGSLPPDAGALVADGYTRIEVPLGNGATEPMWLFAASPAGPGPFPVVVYGHGQGPTNVLPECLASAAPPTHVDVAPSVEIARALAQAGYLGVAVFYRGFGAPQTPGRWSVRDHAVLDARSMLAAARWARDSHGKGSARVAFMGNSMGSFPATWAVSGHPALADLQAGLDLRGAVASGMLGNHLANSSPQFRAIDDASGPANNRVAAIALFTLTLASLRATEAGSSALELSTVDRFVTDLTPAGRELLVATFLAPPPAIPACASVPVAACASGCANAVIADVFARRAGTAIRASDWFTAETLSAFSYWSPPTRIDPGATSNTLLARLRALSPAYALPGPVLGAVFLPLVSTADHTLPAQTGSTNAVGELYLARLRSVGAKPPEPVPVVMAPRCDHGDYYLPARPECGWSAVQSALGAAF